MIIIWSCDSKFWTLFVTVCSSKCIYWQYTVRYVTIQKLFAHDSVIAIADRPSTWVLQPMVSFFLHVYTYPFILTWIKFLWVIFGSVGVISSFAILSSYWYIVSKCWFYEKSSNPINWMSDPWIIVSQIPANGQVSAKSEDKKEKSPRGIGAFRGLVATTFCDSSFDFEEDRWEEVRSVALRCDACRSDLISSKLGWTRAKPPEREGAEGVATTPLEANPVSGFINTLLFSLSPRLRCPLLPQPRMAMAQTGAVEAFIQERNSLCDYTSLR